MMLPPAGRYGRATWRSRTVPGQRQGQGQGCSRQPPLLPPIAKPRRLGPDHRHSWPGLGPGAAAAAAAPAGKENLPPVLRRAQSGRKPAFEGRGPGAPGPERRAAGAGTGTGTGTGRGSGAGSEGEGSESGAEAEAEAEAEARGRIVKWLLEVNLCLFRDPGRCCPPPAAEMDTSIKIVYQER